MRKARKAILVGVVSGAVSAAVVVGSFYIYLQRTSPKEQIVASVPLKPQQVRYDVDEMVEQVVGELTLSKEQREKVIAVVSPIVKLKNQEKLNEAEENELRAHNKKLSDILNQYTKDQFVHAAPTEEIKKLMQRGQVYVSSKFLSLSTCEQNTRYRIGENLTLELEKEEKDNKPVESVSMSREEKRERISAVWERIKKVLPPSLLQRIDCFVPFYCPVKQKEEQGRCPAFLSGSFDVNSVTTNSGLALSNVSSVETGLGVDIACVADDDLGCLAYQLCHEVGHLISLYSEVIPFDAVALVLNEPAYGAMGFSDNSYVKAFFERFYKYTFDDKILDESGYLFYLRHTKDYVSLYASTNVADDFAETFASFVTGEELIANRGRDKVRFLENFPECVKLRDEIQAWHKRNGIVPTRFKQLPNGEKWGTL